MSERQQLSSPLLISLCVPARVEFLHLIRYVVQHAAREFGFSSEDASKIEMSADEACTNVIIHGYRGEGGGDDQTVYVKLFFQSDRMIIQIIDHTSAFSPLEQGDVCLEEHLRTGRRRGLGIYIIKSFMDEITHDYDSETGNKLELVKFLPAKTQKQVGRRN
jgi:serine/threonine-protein kinase RsbW